MHQPYPGLKVISLRQHPAVRHSEFIGEKRAIFSSDAKGDNGAGITKNRMSQAFGQLADVLVRCDQ
jgi:hypothetical protein